MACVQLQCTNQVKANLENCRRRIKEAVERGAELVVLPEDFALVAEEEREKILLTDSDLSRIKESMREEAIRHSIYLLAGGYPTRTEDRSKIYNTATLFSPAGEELAHYHKLHLFDADPPGWPPIRESSFVVRGQNISLIAIPLCTIGFSICYDLRFPELYRSLTLAGANLLVVPAAFTLTTGKDHWQVLIRARAIENQCYVAAAAQWGRHSDKRHSFGQSMICDPWGTPLASAAEGEGIIIAEFDHQRIADVRQIVPALQHIRSDLFAVNQLKTESK
jgi:predicted amidohydrolase